MSALQCSESAQKRPKKLKTPKNAKKTPKNAKKTSKHQTNNLPHFSPFGRKCSNFGWSNNLFLFPQIPKIRWKLTYLGHIRPNLGLNQSIFNQFQCLKGRFGGSCGCWVHFRPQKNKYPSPSMRDCISVPQNAQKCPKTPKNGKKRQKTPKKRQKRQNTKTKIFLIFPHLFVGNALILAGQTIYSSFKTKFCTSGSLCAILGLI